MATPCYNGVYTYGDMESTRLRPARVALLGSPGRYTVWAGVGSLLPRLNLIETARGHNVAEDTSTETETTESDGSVADAVGDAVRAIEEAAAKAAQAAADAGDLAAAQRVSAAVVEAIARAVSDLEDAAETVEQVADEVAENTPPENAGGAESAVDAAHDAEEAVEDAEAEVRDEQREQGGGEVTEGTATEQAIHEEFEEARDEAQPEEVPVIDEHEEIVQEIVSEDKPPLISPENPHPYFRERNIKIFGRTIKL